MFGIDDALIWGPMIGAGVGALTNKNHLKGALMGGAMGAGGAALPGLLGSSAATAAAGGADAAAMAPVADAIPTAVPAAMQAAPTTTAQDLSLIGKHYLNTGLDAAKGAGQAAQAAQSVHGLLGPQQANISPSPISQVPNTGPGGLAQLVQSNNATSQNIANESAQRMARRRSLLGMG